MKRKAFFGWMLVVALLWVTGCSHLHVDLNSSWRIAADAQVFIEVEQPPGEVSGERINERVRQLGWTVVDRVAASDARLVCRWQRAIDLTEDSELTTKIKSFHAKLIATNDERVLGVADYFYGTGEMELWPGVEQALNSLYQRLVVPAAAEATPPGAPGARPVAQESVTVPAAAVEAEATAVRKAPVEPRVELPPAAEPVEAAISEVTTVAQEAPAAVMPVETIETSPAEIPPANLTPVANTVQQDSAIVHIQERPMAIQPVTPESADPQRMAEPETLEVSPWVPRFQGLGLETWGQEEVAEE